MPRSTGSIELTEVVAAHLNPFALVNHRFNAASLVITPSALECDMNPEVLRIDDFQASGAVFVKAIEQLSDSEDAPSFADDNWQGVFKAALVVMVLSLEQITARNSRQSEKNTPTLSPWPLRRSL